MSPEERKKQIERVLQTLEDKPWISPEDLQKMVNALTDFRAEKWWFRTENEFGEKGCLSPMQLRNLKLGLETKTIIPNMLQFENLLKTALHYQRIVLNSK